MGAQGSVRFYPRDGSLGITQAGMFNSYLDCFLHPIRLYYGLLIYALESLLMIKKNFLNFTWLLFCVVIWLTGNPGSRLFWGSKLGARALGCWIFNFTMVWLLTLGFGQVTFAFLVATSPFLERDPILETSWFTGQGHFPALSFFKGTAFESHLLDAIEDEFQKTKRNLYQVSAPSVFLRGHVLALGIDESLLFPFLLARTLDFLLCSACQCLLKGRCPHERGGVYCSPSRVNGKGAVEASGISCSIQIHVATRKERIGFSIEIVGVPFVTVPT